MRTEQDPIRMHARKDRLGPDREPHKWQGALGGASGMRGLARRWVVVAARWVGCGGVRWSEVCVYPDGPSRSRSNSAPLDTAGLFSRSSRSSHRRRMA